MNNTKLDNLIESSVSFFGRPMEDEVAQMRRSLSSKFHILSKNDFRSHFVFHSLFIKQFIRYAQLILENTLKDSQQFWSNKPKIEEAIVKANAEMVKFHPNSNEYRIHRDLKIQFEFQLKFSEFMIVNNNDRQTMLNDLIVFLEDDSPTNKEKVRKIIEIEEQMDKHHDELYNQMVRNK